MKETTNIEKQTILMGRYLTTAKIAKLEECNYKHAAMLRSQVEKAIAKKNKLPMGRGRISVSSYIETFGLEQEVKRIHQNADLERKHMSY